MINLKHIIFNGQLYLKLEKKLNAVYYTLKKKKDVRNDGTQPLMWRASEGNAGINDDFHFHGYGAITIGNRKRFAER